MAAKLQITIDCTNPSAQSRFWRAALGYVEASPPDGTPTWREYFELRGQPPEVLAEIDEGYDKIVDPDGRGPGIWFQPVPEGKSVKNRLHLDIDLTGRTQPVEERKVLVDNEVERLVALGARIFSVAAPAGVDYYGVVLQDPEGNEFCVS